MLVQICTDCHLFSIQWPRGHVKVMDRVFAKYHPHPEVKVIDIELILKLLFMNMLIEYGHSCMKFSFCSASHPLPIPPLPSPDIGTFKARSHFDNACMMGKHQFRRAMQSGDSSCYLILVRCSWTRTGMNSYKNIYSGQARLLCLLEHQKFLINLWYGKCFPAHSDLIFSSAVFEENIEVLS